MPLSFQRRALALALTPPPPSSSLSPLHRPDAQDAATRNCRSCGVRSVALFGVLDPAALADAHCLITPIELQPGEPLFQVGRESEAVYTLRKGFVRFERATADGARRIVRLAGSGDLLGQEQLLQRPHRDDAIACTQASLCRIPVSLVQRLGALHPRLLRELMERWQQALEDSQTWLADLTRGTARRRVLMLLAKMARHAEPGEPTWVPRREEMGDMLNLTIETTSRQISQLRREGVLHSVDRRHVRIDPDMLHRMLQREDQLS